MRFSLQRTIDNRNIMYSSTEDNIQVRKNGSWVEYKTRIKHGTVTVESSANPSYYHKIIGLSTAQIIDYAKNGYRFMEFRKTVTDTSFFNSMTTVGIFPLGGLSDWNPTQVSIASERYIRLYSLLSDNGTNPFKIYAYTSSYSPSSSSVTIVPNVVYDYYNSASQMDGTFDVWFY